MSRISQNLEEALFEAAVAKSSATERAAFLDGACRDNPALRARLEVLLEGHFGGAGFLTQTPEREVVAATVAVSHVEGTPARMIGRYRLLEKIGEGGFGEVWMAEQREPVKRRLALKIIKLGMDTEQVVARFEAERQALALMEHPNIAKVFDAGATESGRLYFVMELVRGTKITHYCDTNALPTRERLRLFILVCQAVQHAHQKGIIHRDLKPSNILVTLHDGVPVPKVIDFGIAKATQQELTEKTVFTQFQQMIGTPAYMSPEQAEMSGLDIDTRSDIYSLGVLLYELLTGRTPLDAKELLASGCDEMRRRIKEEEPVKPSTRARALQGEERTSAAKHRRVDPARLGSELKGDLDWIAMKCLEKDRARRYATANGLAMDIQRHLANEPVVARPPSAAYRFQKLVRRHKLAVAAAAVVMTALLLGAAVSTWQAVEAIRARKSEQRQLIVAKMERDRAHTARQLAEEQRQRAEASETAARSLLYVANINLAQSDWDRNNINRLTHLLEETETHPDRGFEWFYWTRQLHRPIQSFHGHLGPVSSLAISPDGRRLATAGEDRTARVWDIASGRELFTLQGHFNEVASVVFSPDGNRIVTASWDQTAKLWDAASGRELMTFQRHLARVTCAAILPDGSRLVTGSQDGSLKVWDITSGRELQQLGGNDYGVLSVAISPDGTKLVSGHQERGTQIWDLESSRKLLGIEGQGGVRAVAISPDGRRIVTGTTLGTVKVHDLSSGEELLTLRGHTAGVNSVAYSPDGHRIISGSQDQTAVIWNAAKGEELSRVRGHAGGISGVLFSPDGGRVATGSADGTARLWDDQPDSDTLLLGRELSPILDLAISPDGRHLLTGSQKDGASLWDSATGQEVFRLEGHTDWVPSVAFSPDGRMLATSCFDRKARVWDAATGRQRMILEGHANRLMEVAFSPDSRRIATASYDGTLKVWNADTGQEELALAGPGDQLWCVAFSPDGQRIAGGGRAGLVQVWNAKTGEKLFRLKGHSLSVAKVQFSPDGTQIATSGADRTAKVWEAATGRELLNFEGHIGGVPSVRFSPDNGRILTASDDNTVKIWDASAGRELLSLRCQRGSTGGLALSPDGRTIMRATSGRTLQVWKAASPAEIRAWREEEKSIADRLAARLKLKETADERERVIRLSGQGAITRWLVLPPIFAGSGEADRLTRQHLPKESQLHPSAGDRVRVGDQELVWRDVQLTNYMMDFNQVLGQPAENCVFYAVAYLRAPHALSDLRMRVGLDDMGTVYLNGERIHHWVVRDYFQPDRDTLTNVKLKAGLNVLVLKVVNGPGASVASVRLTDEQGEPVTGFEASTTP